MDELQQKKCKLLSELKTIASIQPGQTLSVTSMVITDHNTWSSWAYRKYYKEDMSRTIMFIVNTIRDGISYCECYADREIYSVLPESFKGLLNLKDTYKGLYYTHSDIDRYIDEFKKRYDKINLEAVEIELTEEEKKSFDSSNIPELVEIPDRAVPDEKFSGDINISDPEISVRGDHGSDLNYNEYGPFVQYKDEKKVVPNEEEVEKIKIEQNAQKCFLVNDLTGMELDNDNDYDQCPDQIEIKLENINNVIDIINRRNMVGYGMYPPRVRFAYMMKQIMENN